MRFVNAMLIAFSTYSRIPVPQAEWNEENKRYSMCFFPLIGVVIGAMLALWLNLCDRLALGALIRGAVGAVIPLMVTGGIHMDGFMDTTDAMASWKTPEERLAILKDSHVGAFAVMGCGMYLLLTAGILSEARSADALPIGACYVLSRALSALAMTWFKSAKKTGMLAGFAQMIQKKAVTGASAGFAVPCAAILIISGGWAGVMAAAGAGCVTLVYRHKAYKYFGGITGDLAGWFLQMTEIVTMACVVIGRSVFG